MSPSEVDLKLWLISEATGPEGLNYEKADSSVAFPLKIHVVLLKCMRNLLIVLAKRETIKAH